MEKIRIIMICFGGVFTFAFGLAWIAPLLSAGHKQTEPKKVDLFTGILDLVLVMMECIPIFWVFRAIPEVPSAYKAARDAWAREPLIRTMFWVSTICLSLTIAAFFIPVSTA